MTRYTRIDRITVKYPETGPADRTRLVVLCGLDQEQLQKLSRLSRYPPVVTHVISVQIFFITCRISIATFSNFQTSKKTFSNVLLRGPSQPFLSEILYKISNVSRFELKLIHFNDIAYNILNLLKATALCIKY